MARPFKVFIPAQKKQFGVVARNLRLLREDIQKRYGLENDLKICLPDGTAIDDEEYFAFLEPQTLLIVRRGNSILDTLISDGGKEVITRSQTKASLLKITQVKGSVSWDSTAQSISSTTSPQTAVVYPQAMRTTSSSDIKTATKPLQHIPYIPPSQPVESYCTDSRFSSSYHPVTPVHHLSQQQLVDSLANHKLLELQQQQLQLRQQHKLLHQQQQQLLLPANSQTGTVLQQQQPTQQRYVLQQQQKVLERNYYRVLHCPSGHAGSGQVPGRQPQL